MNGKELLDNKKSWFEVRNVRIFQKQMYYVLLYVATFFPLALSFVSNSAPLGFGIKNSGRFAKIYYNPQFTQTTNNEY